MDEPTPKRRRTNSPDERAPNSLRKPPRRPSFASPTKSSLARNYPNLLPSRPASGRDGLQETQTDAPEEEDTELPSAQPRNEQDVPRRGILFSSPSRKPPRIKGVAKELPPIPKAPPVESSYLGGTSENNDVVDATQQDIQPLDPEIEKRKQEKARLQREMEDLEAQVSRCTEEIVKEQQRTPEQQFRHAERTDLIDFIGKIYGTDAEEKQPPLISSLLCSFLPFSGLAVLPPRRKQPDSPIPSHRPIELADPLPYLEMFTSFKFSTQLSLPRGKVFPSSNRVHQKHTIDIVGPQKLLTVQLSIIIDAMANEIIDMQILHLSSWAERELGTFLRQKAKEKDLGNACWAIDSYWEIATKRAQYWHKCEASFSHLIAGHTDEDTENTRPQVKANQTISRKDLNRHLGRDTLVLQDKHVLLKINWRISFDWTGEAESEVSVEPAFPRVWSEGDAANAFKKIPETFISLLQTRGAYEATRVMTALLFPQ
ncbi:hypothetical protein P153DRAFT_308130 [Dothidotthia symphoricarpi CBS 119687]|uniref:Uncharacterized protein n=1 Tax=Dothidotthia symphoricarpi CBS 119687 TaxID=1392245 RepID=A0A6A6AN09_9PLEO|nr:uncharacterized protein P153DRAFT_308130 [Dothidotthia symphoricarpi CBS 119687]KAF2133372.1 hypothetical protein P153DRAFT_308130 [Dothidotthia symphoricarpi CBS 119687]